MESPLHFHAPFCIIEGTVESLCKMDSQHYIHCHTLSHATPPHTNLRMHQAPSEMIGCCGKQASILHIGGIRSVEEVVMPNMTTSDYRGRGGGGRNNGEE